MKAKVLVPIIIGAVVLTVAIIFLILALSTPTVNKTHVIEDPFANFTINVSTTDIEFSVSDDGTVKVVTDETEKQYHRVEVADNTLIITRIDDRNVFEKLYGFGHKFKVHVYLPATEYGNLNLKTTTGDVKVAQGLTFNSAEIKLTTGDVSFLSDVKDSFNAAVSTGNVEIGNMNLNKLTLISTTGNKRISNVTAQETVTISSSTGNTTLDNVTCKSLSILGTTGSVTLNNTQASDSFTITASTGNVTLNDADAGTIFIKTTTGNVKGTLLTNKIIFAETNTGHANVPHLTEGGKCEIKTSTGNIEISIKE